MSTIDPNKKDAELLETMAHASIADRNPHTTAVYATLAVARRLEALTDVLELLADMVYYDKNGQDRR